MRRPAAGHRRHRGIPGHLAGSGASRPRRRVRRSGASVPRRKRRHRCDDQGRSGRVAGAGFRARHSGRTGGPMSRAAFTESTRAASTRAAHWASAWCGRSPTITEQTPVCRTPTLVWLSISRSRGRPADLSPSNSRFFLLFNYIC